MILDRILVQERRLQFSIVEEGIPLTGRRPAVKPSKAKKKSNRKPTGFRPPKPKKGNYKTGKRR